MSEGAPSGERPGTRAAGIWIGLVSSFLVASLGMVQVRAKIFGGYPSGDWARDGYTWHFLLPFAACLLLWWLAARVWSRRASCSLRVGLEAIGRASAPLLGLVTAWSWYGLTGDQFHLAHGCDTYLLCHDVGPAPIVVWSAPWILWAGYRWWRLWAGTS